MIRARPPILLEVPISYSQAELESALEAEAKPATREYLDGSKNIAAPTSPEIKDVVLKLQKQLGDGATWVWNLARERFFDNRQAVDRYYPKQHLSQVAAWVVGEEMPPAEHWLTESQIALFEDKANQLADPLEDSALYKRVVAKAVRRQAGYFATTRGLSHVWNSAKTVTHPRGDYTGTHSRCSVNHRFDIFWAGVY